MRRCEILHQSADMAEKIDINSLNWHYDSVTTVVTDWLIGQADYRAYLTAILIAHGERPGSRYSRTHLLYTTRDLSREVQVERLRLAAGIIANNNFYWR